MDKVQYVGPIEILRGQTALAQEARNGTAGTAEPGFVWVQWDWPEGQKFTPRGEPVDAPEECFGWHKTPARHWRVCHTIGELSVI